MYSQSFEDAASNKLTSGVIVSIGEVKTANYTEAFTKPMINAFRRECCEI
jgi:hypothetical protein